MRMAATNQTGQPPKASLRFWRSSYSRFAFDPTGGRWWCSGFRGFWPLLPTACTLPGHHTSSRPSATLDGTNAGQGLHGGTFP